MKSFHDAYVAVKNEVAKDLNTLGNMVKSLAGSVSELSHQFLQLNNNLMVLSQALLDKGLVSTEDFVAANEKLRAQVMASMEEQKAAQEGLAEDPNPLHSPGAPKISMDDEPLIEFG